MSSRFLPIHSVHFKTPLESCLYTRPRGRDKYFFCERSALYISVEIVFPPYDDELTEKCVTAKGKGLSYILPFQMLVETTE